MEYKDIKEKISKIDISVPLPEKEPDRQYHYMAILKEKIREISQKKGRVLTYNINTFGCQMNARDSEKIEGILMEIGYQQSDTNDADIVLYNTCTVRENANLKVYGRLGQLKKAKEKNPDMLILLCGCMMQEQTVVEKIKKSYRYVDIIFGTHNIYKLAELLAKKLLDSENAPSMIIDILKDTDKIVEELPNERKYHFKSGVNIMFGCNNFCSYCIVPYVRGRERSREPEDILAEIKCMVSDGVVEIMLLGQNVNSYGKNLENPISFAELLRRVEKIDGLERIRFMTSHPKDLSPELIDVMSQSDKICNHLHLPLQSGSSRVLKHMNRHYDKEKYLSIVSEVRRKCPDIAITTDIIVGYPGETEDDFMETLDVVDKVRFDSAYTFIYSPRTGTPAAAMEQPDENIVRERFDRLLSKVRTHAEEQAKKDEGKTVKVLVEEVNDKDNTLVTGKTEKNYSVHFKGDKSLVGKFVDVRLKETKGFYYIGECVV